jgi:glycosyltransferase involved in cell wall biosynthesis
MKKEIKNLRVAIVHDWAYKMTGGEKVLEVICEMFPNADVYMMMGDETHLSDLIRKHKIQYSFLQKIPFVKKFYRYTYPLWPVAIESFNFNNYDLVVSSSACAAKGVITGLNTVHICYMHTPMRYAWDLTWYYFNPLNFSWWKRIVIPIFLTFLRSWDVASTSRIDKLIANSNFVNRRIQKYYRRSADKVIFPPVYMDLFTHLKEKENFYFCIAPYEPNKRGDLIVELGIKLGINIKIAGKGSKMKELQAMAKGHENIEFLGFISEEEKADLMARAKGLFFFGLEDFGIVPLEASASGTPVLAYGDGGALDSVIDGRTGMYFKEQSVSSIIEVFKKFEEAINNNVYDKEFMREHANKFSKERFVKEVGDLTQIAIDEYFVTLTEDKS